jgi:hypothetical protein
MHKAKKKGSARCTRSQGSFHNFQLHIKIYFSRDILSIIPVTNIFLLSERGFWALRKPRRSGNTNTVCAQFKSF